MCYGIDTDVSGVPGDAASRGRSNAEIILDRGVNCKQCTAFRLRGVARSLGTGPARHCHSRACRPPNHSLLMEIHLRRLKYIKFKCTTRKESDRGRKKKKPTEIFGEQCPPGTIAKPPTPMFDFPQCDL